MRVINKRIASQSIICTLWVVRESDSWIKIDKGWNLGSEEKGKKWIYEGGGGVRSWEALSVSVDQRRDASARHRVVVGVLLLCFSDRWLWVLFVYSAWVWHCHLWVSDWVVRWVGEILGVRVMNLGLFFTQIG